MLLYGLRSHNADFGSKRIVKPELAAVIAWLIGCVAVGLVLGAVLELVLSLSGNVLKGSLICGGFGLAFGVLTVMRVPEHVQEFFDELKQRLGVSKK